MSIYHCHLSVVSAGQGQNIIASAAYNGREALEDERTGKVKDYSFHSDEVKWGGIFVPKEAPKEWLAYRKWDKREDLTRSRERLWNDVQNSETRKDSQFARQFVASIPHELTEEEQHWLVREFVRDNFMMKGMIADVNIHGPGKDGDERNTHVHILLTMREIGWKDFAIKNKDDGEVYKLSHVLGLKGDTLTEFMEKGSHLDRDALSGFDVPKQRRAPGKTGHVKDDVGKLFRRSKNAKEFKALLESHGYELGNLGPKGFGRKVREWNTVEQLEAWREAWAVFGAKQLRQAAARRREKGLIKEANKLDKEAARFSYAHKTLPEQRKIALERGDKQHAKSLEHSPQRYKGWYQTQLERRRHKRQEELKKHKRETTVLAVAGKSKTDQSVKDAFAGAKKILKTFLYRVPRGPKPGARKFRRKSHKLH